MATHRINPDTGVVEKDVNSESFLTSLLGEQWTSASDEGGESVRVNPDTGVVERDVNSGSWLSSLFGEQWTKK